MIYIKNFKKYFYKMDDVLMFNILMNLRRYTSSCRMLAHPLTGVAGYIGRKKDVDIKND